jgi:hypothetical protein
MPKPLENTSLEREAKHGKLKRFTRKCKFLIPAMSGVVLRLADTSTSLNAKRA